MCKCPEILIVDDSEVIRMILQEILKSNGYSFINACNGQEALQLVKQRQEDHCCHRFQAIIMDCEMPILDGWEATLKIRQLGYKAPIIGYTAYAYEKDVERCLKAGMNKVLFKPSKSEVIIEEIRRFQQ